MDIEKLEKIEDKIIIIRNEQVLLDSDVAEIYGVETKRINEAAKTILIDSLMDTYWK